MGSGPEILFLRGCIVSEDSCYISTWGEFMHLAMYFMGYHSLLIRVRAKKKKKKKKKRKKKKKDKIKNDDSALFIISFFIGHVYGRARLLH